MKTKILVIEDEEKIARFIELELKHEGYEVSKAFDGREGLEMAQSGSFDLILLDIMLPLLNGLEVLRRIRKMSEVPVIMLTARDAVMDKVSGLDAGADDYITKPFSMPVLIRKIAAILRRTSKQEDTPHIMSYKDLTLDLDGYKVYSSEGNIELTPREFEILRELLNHKGRILTRQNFLQTLWKYEFFGDERIIDTHIKNLRKKLGTVDYIETIRGVGYRIDKEDKE